MHHLPPSNAQFITIKESLKKAFKRNRGTQLKVTGQWIDFNNIDKITTISRSHKVSNIEKRVFLMATLVLHQTRPNLVSPCKNTSPTAKQLLAAARSPCTWTGDTGSNTKRVELGLDFNAAPAAVLNISIVAFFLLAIILFYTSPNINGTVCFQ